MEPTLKKLLMNSIFEGLLQELIDFEPDVERSTMEQQQEEEKRELNEYQKEKWQEIQANHQKQQEEAAKDTFRKQREEFAEKYYNKSKMIDLKESIQERMFDYQQQREEFDSMIRGKIEIDIAKQIDDEINMICTTSEPQTPEPFCPTPPRVSGPSFSLFSCSEFYIFYYNFHRSNS